MGRGAFTKSTLAAMGQRQLYSKSPREGQKGGAGVRWEQHTPGQTYTELQ